MNRENYIPIAEVIGTSIHTRESSTRLMEIVNKNQGRQIELDFSGVEYISRSFADQFYVDKLFAMKRAGKTIIVANAAEGVLKMLESVAKTQKHSAQTAMEVPIYRFSSNRELEDFLLGY